MSVIDDKLSRQEKQELLPPINIPSSFNYIAVFLTFACNLSCSYCINRFGGLHQGERLMNADQWRRGLNRIISRPDLPVTLQGGEPAMHPDFFSIVNGIRPETAVDLLTNLEIDAQQFMQEVAPERIRRDAPYASIRVSYHPESMKIQDLAAKVRLLLDRGYSIGIWGVLHPKWEQEILRAKDYCLRAGIDFRTKEFLGEYEGVMHGEFSYPYACSRLEKNEVLCRTTELIIGPGGDVYRCHGDLYEDRKAVGHILDPGFALSCDFRPCSSFGYCNPCDVKLKTNRYQEFGHTSVEIITARSGGGED